MKQQSTCSKPSKLSVYELALFGLLGGLMYVSKLFMEALPNIHLLGMFIVAETVVFRKKALYPIYVYVLLDGLFGGFGLWWVPYLYIWTVLWGVVMLLPRNMSKKTRVIVYALVSGLHGLTFGILYAPFQMLAFSMNLKTVIAWVAAGFPFDLIHGISNFLCGFLICPLIHLLQMARNGFAPARGFTP